MPGSGTYSLPSVPSFIAQHLSRSLRPEDIEREPIEAHRVERLRAAHRTGRLRQVASFDPTSGEAAVRLVAVGEEDALTDLADERNAVQITLHDGSRISLVGKGAGRSPTAVSVCADLGDVLRELFAQGLRENRLRSENAPASFGCMVPMTAHLVPEGASAPQTLPTRSAEQRAAVCCPPPAR